MLLDITGRLVVIVGGGAVGVRKARGVIEAGATRVRCVSPSFHAQLPASVEKVQDRYAPRHLDGAGLVFAATDSAGVNEAVVRDARARGVIVSRADAQDEEEPGDFVTPAKWTDGVVTVAVSAGGSPALALRIRDGLVSRWDPRWSAMADALAVLRPALRGAGAGPAVRRDVMRDLASDEALNVLGSGQMRDLLRWLYGRHPGLPPVKFD